MNDTIIRSHRGGSVEYQDARRMGSGRLGVRPLPLAYGEVAETGRARWAWGDYLVVLGLIMVGATFLAWVL